MSTGGDLPCAGDGAAEYVCIGSVAPFFLTDLGAPRVGWRLIGVASRLLFYGGREMSKIAIIELSRSSKGCADCIFAINTDQSDEAQCPYFSRKSELDCGTEYGNVWRLSGVYTQAEAK